LCGASAWPLSCLPRSASAAADAALAGAKGYAHNTFKIELAKRSIVRALNTVTAKA